jgi:hypothetical protein
MEEEIKKTEETKEIKKEEKVIYGGFSLGLGISSLVLFFAPYFAFPLSIMAIVFSRVQQKKKHSGLATAGLITGIIGLVMSLIMGLFMFVYFAIVGF